MTVFAGETDDKSARFRLLQEYMHGPGHPLDLCRRDRNAGQTAFVDMDETNMVLLVATKAMPQPLSERMQPLGESGNRNRRNCRDGTQNRRAVLPFTAGGSARRTGDWPAARLAQ